VRLEPREQDGTALCDVASTPRRCVWNRWSGMRSNCSSSLQPLEGASGTGAAPRSRGTGRCFNPSKVRLELHLVLAGLGHDLASTPRRCVWNGLAQGLDLGLVHASTPRRCVWNSAGCACIPRPVPASTPRRCVWNACSGPA